MRLLPRLLDLSMMATPLVIAFRCDWTLYEFALLVVYDATLIALLALLARPLQAVLTMLDLAMRGRSPATLGLTSPSATESAWNYWVCSRFCSSSTC
ncbi:MAG: hypothetical protein IPH76_08400 [Xanthomonadales bacterium]|nr:hypothetical protein [Xanthomonadales bacterium]